MAGTEKTALLLISKRMSPGLFKTIMEFLENNPNSTIQKISADKSVKKTKGEVREATNFLRRIGFVSVKQENKTHLFSARCVFSPDELPLDINKFMGMGMAILPIIEAYGPNEMKIFAEDIHKKIELKTGKNIPREVFEEFIRLLPKVKKRITVYNCPASEKLTINFAQKNP